MNHRPDQNDPRYRALAEAALAASAGEPIDRVAEKGLAGAVEFIGLAAGSLVLWDSGDEIVTRVVTAETDEDRQTLEDTENTLLMMLRHNFALRSAYMELGGKDVKSVFFLPIEIESRQFGALIGIRSERVRLHEYDEFLRALAAILALVSAPHRAIEDLAVGVNHEINNLLTPLMGNLELLEGLGEDLPEDIRRKLSVIHESARKIKAVVQKLKEVSSLPRVPYVDDEWMIKLSDDETGESDKDDKE